MRILWETWTPFWLRFGYIVDACFSSRNFLSSVSLSHFTPLVFVITSFNLSHLLIYLSSSSSPLPLLSPSSPPSLLLPLFIFVSVDPSVCFPLQVSDSQNSTYHLKTHLLFELDVDSWPFYNEAERSLVKR